MSLRVVCSWLIRSDSCFSGWSSRVRRHAAGALRDGVVDEPVRRDVAGDDGQPLVRGERRGGRGDVEEHQLVDRFVGGVGAFSCHHRPRSQGKAQRVRLVVEIKDYFPGHVTSPLSPNFRVQLQDTTSRRKLILTDDDCR